MLVGSVVLLGAAGTVVWALWPAWYGWLAALPLLAVWGWVLAFFRDPERPVPVEGGVFVSPADGTITDVTPLGPESALGCEGVSIGIFLSVFSVHVNRAPCDGQVVGTDYRKGRFLDARREEAGQCNEAMNIRLDYCPDGQRYPLMVRQIAGKIARRIVCGVEPGQAVQRGQRIGLIKFGSRTELWLPRELARDIRVRVGQKVYGAKTILAAHANARNGNP